MMKKMLKRTIAIGLSVALAVTGVKADGICKVKADDQKEVRSETKITAQQKKKAEKEDKEICEKLEQTKEKKEKNKNATVVKEIKSLRTANSTTYLLSNGSRKLEIYGEDIRYKENGKYVDFDTSLKKISKNETKELVDKNAILDKEAVEKYAYVNTAGDAKHYFPEILDEDRAIVMSKKKHTISFGPIKKENDVQESLKNKKDTEIVEEDNQAVVEYKESGFEKEDVSDKELQIEKKSVKEDNLTYSDGGKVAYKYTSLKNGIKEDK